MHSRQPQPTDLARLVMGARAGDSQAWDDLVERFLPLVCGTIARLGLRGADADDVNQTVWLRLVEHLDAIREPDALPGWIATTTRHECLRTFDRGRRTVPVDPQLGGTDLDASADEGDLDDDLVHALERQALRDALEELPEDRRRLLLLLVQDPPLAYRDISDRLGIPIGSIGPTRARALRQLRGCAELMAYRATRPARTSTQEGRGR